MRLVPILVLLGALLAGVVAPATAQPAGGESESPAARLERWDSEATEIQSRIEEGELTASQIESMRSTLEAQRTAVPELISATETELEPLKQQLEALGEPPEESGAESAEIRAERERLQTRIADVEARLKLLNQADARAEALLSQLAEIRRELFTRELLTRGPSPLEPGVVARALASLRTVAAGIVVEAGGRLGERGMDLPFVLRAVLPLVLLAAALVLVLGVRRALLERLIGRVDPETRQGRPTLAGIGATLVRLVLPILALVLVIIGARISGFLGPQGATLVRGLAWSALVVIGAYALGGAFYSPYAPALRLSRLPEASANAAHRWLMALAAVAGLDRVLVVEGEELGLSIAALSLLNTALLVLGSAAVWGYVWHLRPLPPESTSDTAATEAEEDEDEDEAEDHHEVAIGPLFTATLRLVARVVAVLAPLLALAGYFAASRFAFYPVVFSGAVVGFCILLFHAVQDTVDRLVTPAGGDEDGAPSRIRLIPVFVGFFLICAAIPVLALVWGADLTDLSEAWRAFSAGFKVGEVTVSPVDFFSFLLVFAIGYVLTRVVQGVLRRSVLPVTRLDAGGRAAVSAGVFYIGVFLAALIAISATGLDLSNLALVAGALSVGIGFGLQNVVNNFVSGLILLLERPIKAGDWIQLASGMGYVKQIRVRSTEIDTFDRAALIVPNSELISSSVINWTHTNMQGRLIVPVRVAYGTDPKKVEEVLLEIARAHPMMLRRPAPFVLFRSFGPDALEFEIRGILRDVNWVLNVHSEINFEIVRRFREEGLQIPFPQRDLHLRNTDEMAESIRGAIRGDGTDEPEPPEAPGSAAPARRRRRRPEEPSRGEGGADPDA